MSVLSWALSVLSFSKLESLVSLTRCGAFQIDVDGRAQEYYVQCLQDDKHCGPSCLSTTSTSVSMHSGHPKAYLAANTSLSVESYAQFKLLGKRLSYDVDLSAVGCSCNAALYFVSMPGVAADGSLAPGDSNDYYCDANEVGGVWCWEMDTLESNQFAIAATPHRCSAPAGGTYIGSCDRSGCGTNSWKIRASGIVTDLISTSIRLLYRSSHNDDTIKDENAVTHGAKPYQGPSLSP